MTKEELLTKGVYIPERIDESIVSNLLLGNTVVVEAYDIDGWTPYGFKIDQELDIVDIDDDPELQLWSDFDEHVINKRDFLWINGKYSDCYVSVKQAREFLKYFDYD